MSYLSIDFTNRELDSTKIDWRSLPHSNCSMIKEGVYPPGTSRTEVEKKVRGTFGGRTEYGCLAMSVYFQTKHPTATPTIREAIDAAMEAERDAKL